WYRPTVVPSEWDRTAATLPYDPLLRDIRDNWPEYRRAFRPMNELSGVVEAFALLRAVNRQNQAVWARFRDRLTQGLDLDEYKKVGMPAVTPSTSPSLGREGWE